MYGPGLQPKNIVMPARYFFVNFTSFNESSYSTDFAAKFAVEINGKSLKTNKCRIWVNTLDRKDGTFIIRYKVYETCTEIVINIYYQSKHIQDSPFKYEGPIHPDQCDCPQKHLETWLREYQCPLSYEQINNDLRDCYGKHVGFNMFADNILLSLTRKVVMPDMELVINLGDWPLVHKTNEPLPIFSWCGNDETLDIVMPTYDITESALENMGRVTLDTLSVQGSIGSKWKERENRAFWRGRDSRAERLQLIDIARAYPDLINASLTNFFFFREKEAQYGPKMPHVSFFKFFDYKYQINIDGTVAAYRFPYLLSGGGLVFKQDSPYYEHFYKQLQPWKHYVPIKRDLKDLPDLIKWAQEHDDEAYKIARNARDFANENLLPQHILCYHAVLFREWSKRNVGEINVKEKMTLVPQPKFDCQCDPADFVDHDEL
ncbi:unnamed protein product, partial [Brenthis ino]